MRGKQDDGRWNGGEGAKKGGGARALGTPLDALSSTTRRDLFVRCSLTHATPTRDGERAGTDGRTDGTDKQVARYARVRETRRSLGVF